MAGTGPRPGRGPDSKSTPYRLRYLISCVGGSDFSLPKGYRNQLPLLTEKDFLTSFQTNCSSALFLAQAFEQHLRNSNSTDHDSTDRGAGPPPPGAAATPEPNELVFISSRAGLTGIGSNLPYAVAKGALNTLSLALAQTLAPEVRVQSLCPGFVDSSWWGPVRDNDPERYSSMKSGMKTVLTVDDVAATVLEALEGGAGGQRGLQWLAE